MSVRSLISSFQNKKNKIVPAIPTASITHNIENEQNTQDNFTIENVRNQAYSRPNSGIIIIPITVSTSGHETRFNNWTVGDPSNRSAISVCPPSIQIDTANDTANDAVDIPCRRLRSSNGNDLMSDFGPLAIVFSIMLVLVYFYWKFGYQSSCRIWYAGSVFTDCLLLSWPIYWVECSDEISGFIKLKISQLKSNFGYYD